MGAIPKPLETVTATMTDVRRHLGTYLDRIKAEGVGVIITRYGEPVAVLVPVDWYGLDLL